jgi:SSS family solute:Na+ symporter
MVKNGRFALWCGVLIAVALLALYAALMLAIGLAGLFRVRGAEDYLVAGRRGGGLRIGGSLAATIVGASATLGLAGLAFRRGLTGSWWLLVGAPGLVALWFLARRARGQPVYSLPGLLGHWYGPLMRRVSAALIALAWLGIVGAQASASGRLLSTFLGGSYPAWTLAAGGLFVLYTMMGGQVSVIGTDLPQLLLIVGGLAGSAIFGLREAGGFGGLRSALDPGFFAFPLSPGFSSVELVMLLLVVGSTYLAGPDMLSRLFCSRSLASARRGILLSIAVIVPLAFLIALLGMLARALYPGADPEAALPLLIKGTLSPLVAGLAMLALLSSFMSSGDTTLLTLTTVLAVDLLGFDLAKLGPRRSLGLLRGFTAAAGAGSVLVGLYSGGIIPSLLLAYSVFSGGLFVPILAGLVGRPLRPRAALAAALAGGALALAGRLLGRDLLTGAGFAVCLAVWLADALLASRRPSRTDDRRGGL